MISETYQVMGMTCEHCVRAVSSELVRPGRRGGVTVDLVPDGASAVTVTSQGPLPRGRRGRAGRGGDYRLAGTESFARPRSIPPRGAPASTPKGADAPMSMVTDPGPAGGGGAATSWPSAG